MAVHSNCGNAEIRPATTLVLPTLRECPPMMTRATANPFSPGASTWPTASDIGEAVAPEFPKTQRPFPAEFCWAGPRPGHRASLPLQYAHARRCLPALRE